MVHSRAALGEKTANRRVLLEGLEQLDPAVSDAHRSGPHTLVVHRGAMLDLGTEKPLVRRKRLVEVANCHTKMMNPPRLHPNEAIEQKDTSPAQRTRPQRKPAQSAAYAQAN